MTAAIDLRIGRIIYQRQPNTGEKRPLLTRLEVYDNLLNTGVNPSHYFVRRSHGKGFRKDAVGFVPTRGKGEFLPCVHLFQVHRLVHG